jgi:dynein heavy chain
VSFAVAMMVPDYRMIAEIKLNSFGFEEARALSEKIVVTIRLSSEQLSSQIDVIKDVNVPKFLMNGLVLLNDIFSHLFHGQTERALDYTKLISAVQEVAKKRKLFFQKLLKFVMKMKDQKYYEQYLMYQLMLFGLKI